jgi:hypothetical protein
MATRWPSTGPTTVSPIEPSCSRPQLRRSIPLSMSSPDSALRDLEELQRRKIRRLVADFAALRRMSALRSTRQDAQINYLSTLSIFRKQTTYLATLPKRFGKVLNSIYPISCISSPHKVVILSEALRRSIANRGLYGAESKSLS